MNKAEKQEIIQRNLGGYITHGKSYPEPLPKELADWYVYICDGGHSICCILKQHFDSDLDLTLHLVPVPVKTVLKEYDVKGDYIVVSVPYNDDTGLNAPEEDDEFDPVNDRDYGNNIVLVSFVAQDGKRIWDNGKNGRPMVAPGMKSGAVSIVSGHPNQCAYQKLDSNGCLLRLTVVEVPDGEIESVLKMTELLLKHGMPDFWRICDSECLCGYDRLKRYAIKPDALQHE